MKATDYCNKAAELVSGDRHDTYGDALVTHSDIARAWSLYLRTELSAEDVTLMMALLKIMRARRNKAHRDSLVDAIGYVALAGEIIDRKYQ